jgi:hypothetical protein
MCVENHGKQYRGMQHHGKSCEKYNRIVQVGQQQRSGFIFQKAMEAYQKRQDR